MYRELKTVQNHRQAMTQMKKVLNIPVFNSGSGRVEESFADNQEDGGYMKIKISALALIFIEILLLSGCNSGTEKHLAIPENYTVDKNLYVAQENGIYAFIENSKFDYEGINSELCKGNAASVKEQYEKMEIPENDLIDYAALQNILGITEIYLSDYARAYDHFCDAIQFTERGNPPEKDSVLTVLYNNAGAATIYLSANAPEDRRLLKASGLCRDPYMGLVIAISSKVYCAWLHEAGIKAVPVREFH